MTISDNKQGNPYHDEEGKFTSPDSAALGASEEDFASYLKGGTGLKIKSGAGALLKGQMKLKSGAGALLKSLQKDPIQSMPVSRRTEDIISNIFTSVNKDYIKDVLQYYDENETYQSDRDSPVFYSYVDDSGRTRQRRSNLFIHSLINKRFPNKANPISQEEYDKKLNTIRDLGSGQLNAGYDKNFSDGQKFLRVQGFNYENTHVYERIDEEQKAIMRANIDKPELRDLGCGMIAAFRGLDLNADSATIDDLKRAYVGKGTADPVMSCGGNSGTSHYIAMQRSYADNYRSWQRSKNNLLKMIINAKDANIATDIQLNALRNRIDEEINSDASFKPKLLSSFKNALIENGYSDGPSTQDLADKMAADFMATLVDDNGLVAALAGVQMMIAGLNNGNQCDLYDLSIADILEDF